MFYLGLKTDMGLVRNSNEDSCLAKLISVEGREYALLAVADGIGGHRAGDVASRTANSHLEQKIGLELAAGMAPLAALKQAVIQANEAVYRLSQSEERFRGMGTTLTAAIMTEERLYVAHVGDSRLYLFRSLHCQQLTRDHSLVSELVINGELSLQEARDHPQRNVLTKAVGIEREVEADFASHVLQSLDVVVLASDGLYSLVDETSMARFLQQEKDLNLVAENLVQAANDLGGHDNISVVLARWGWQA